MEDGLDTINSLVSSAKSAVNSVSTMTTKAGTLVNGSHKNGLNRVPYDGYIAELHEGERVLTKEEADAQDNGHGDTFIFNSPKAIDEKEAARQMKKVKQQLSLSYQKGGYVVCFQYKRALKTAFPKIRFNNLLWNWSKVYPNEDPYQNTRFLLHQHILHSAFCQLYFGI